MMKKIVPDPPLPCTSTRPFGRCDAGHEPLFTGRGMYWSSLHSIELAEGLVEAILDGIESIPTSRPPQA